MSIVKLGEVLKQVKQAEFFDNPEKEILVTVSGKGQGAIRRKISEGKTPVPFSGYRVKEGQLIYSRIGAGDGAFALISNDLDGAAVSKDFPVFEINENIMLKEYLILLLCSKYFINKISGKSFGATLKRLKEDTLLNTKINIPSIEEQQKEINIINKARSLILNKEHQLKVYDNLIKARFVEMFGDFNQAIISIGSTAKFINGKAFKPSDWSHKGIPIIRIQNLNNIDAPYNYFDGRYNPKYHVEKGDLLFSWSGTPGTSFGAFVWNKESGVLNQHIFKVIPKENFDKIYLKYALNSKVNQMIAKAHGGVGLQHITKQELESILIPFPEKWRQTIFANYACQVDKSKFVIQKSLKKTQMLFDSLMQEYFGG